MARKEAEYKKREAEAEAKRQAEAKTRAEAEAKERAEAAAKAKVEAEARAKREAEEKAKRELDLKARAEQEAKAKAEFAKREAELKKRVEEAESKPGGKKQAIKLAASGGSLQTRVFNALASARGNKSETARALGWSRMTLYRRLAEYNASQKRAR